MTLCTWHFQLMLGHFSHHWSKLFLFSLWHSHHWSAISELESAVCHAVDHFTIQIGNFTQRGSSPHKIFHLEWINQFLHEHRVTVMNFEMWCLKVSFSKKGDAFNPKTTQQNLKTIPFNVWGFSSHKNRKQSLSALSSSTLRKAFSMSQRELCSLKTATKFQQ